MTSLSEFHCFPTLPPEIRAIIWRLCLPQRIHGDIWPRRGLPFSSVRQCEDRFCEWKNTHATLPVLSQVCCESREEVFRHGQYLDISKMEHERISNPDTIPTSNRVWFQPQLDMVVHPDRRNPEYWTIPAAMETDGCGVCIESRLLLSHSKSKNYMESRSFVGGIRNIMRLEGRPECDVIVCRIGIHGPREAAQKSGLFGLLGDSSRRLIDPNDVTSIRALCALHEETGGRGTGHLAVLAWAIDNNKNWKKLSGNIQLMQKSYTKVWVWCRWQRARQGARNTLPDFDQVWVPKAHRTSWKFQYDYQSSYFQPPSRNWWASEIRGRSPNPENDWVVQTIETMPEFRPKILVEFCNGPESHYRDLEYMTDEEY